MSCGCRPDNDKCVQDECRNCCYCGKLLTDDPFYNGIRHVDPPTMRPTCAGSETGEHEPLHFPQPKEHEDRVFLVAGSPAPVSTMIVNGVIAVRMCKLCGIVYWEPLK